MDHNMDVRVCDTSDIGERLKLFCSLNPLTTSVFLLCKSTGWFLHGGNTGR